MLFGFPEAICCSFPSPLFPSPIGANLPNPSLPQIFGAGVVGSQGAWDEVISQIIGGGCTVPPTPPMHRRRHNQIIRARELHDKTQEGWNNQTTGITNDLNRYSSAIHPQDVKPCHLKFQFVKRRIKDEPPFSKMPLWRKVQLVKLYKFFH